MEKVGQFASALGTLGMADPYDPETRKPHNSVRVHGRRMWGMIRTGLDSAA